MRLMKLKKNQQIYQNYHSTVMPNQTPPHAPAHQRHHQGAHMIPTSHPSVHITKKYFIRFPVMHTDKQPARTVQAPR
jgi:hypothetical protein